MKIKQLEWVTQPIDRRGDIYLSARTPYGLTYWIYLNTGLICYVYVRAEEYHLSLLSLPGVSIEEVKAAAQADFEKRAMACFETTDKSNFWG